ncbi:uncharacterized protein [Aegilops tauschii subsp. strangulata]|uniref:uncharacterized protein n=1 Tax=Aegilops tauschii subsp. strangulata TaxID=200361 RepID=UPI003CC8584B
MGSYRFLVQQINGHFDGCEFLHVPRADNEAADALAWISSTWQAIPAGVSLECLRKPPIKPSLESESISVPADPGAVGSGLGTSAVGSGTSVGGPGIAVIGPGTSTTQQVVAGSDPLPPNTATLTPVALMMVVEAPSWVQLILNFLSLIAKAFRHGFFSPTALDDAKELVRKCNGC